MTSSGDRDRSTRAPDAGPPYVGLPRGAIWRAAWFLGIWLVMAGAHVADLPAAVVAVVLATWASLRLLPPGGPRISVPAVARLVLDFLYQSVVAGVDVARRALDPRLPLKPGFVTYPIGLPPGAARNIFTTLTSLLPGTVPAADEGRKLVYHCLDLDQPVFSQLAAEEAALARTLRSAGGAR
jgi:multicomponent Na+:H+ antiporter subunit E